MAAFLGHWLVLTTLGAGLATDACFAAATAVQFVSSLVNAPLIHVLVPLLADRRPGSAPWPLASFLAGSTAASALAAALVAPLAPVCVPVLVPGLPADMAVLAVRLLQVQLLGLVLTGPVVVITAAHQARGRFVHTETASLISGLAVVAALPWGLACWGIWAAAWAAALRPLLQALLLLPGLGPVGRVDWRHPEIPVVLGRAGHLVSGALVHGTDPLVDRALASLAAPGALSLYHLAQQLYMASTHVLGRFLAAPMVPVLAVAAGAGRRDLFLRGYRLRLLAAAALTLPVLAALVLAGSPPLGLLVGHGEVTPANVSTLHGLLVALGGLLVFGPMAQITSSAFYARGDTRTPNRLGIATYLVYVPLKLLAFWRWGLPGLAAATGAYYAASVAIRCWVLERPAGRVERPA